MAREMLVYYLPPHVEVASVRGALTDLAESAGIPHKQHRIAYLLWLLATNRNVIDPIIGKSKSQGKMNPTSISFKVPSPEFGELLSQALQTWASEMGFVSDYRQNKQIGRLLTRIAEREPELRTWIERLSHAV